MSVVEHFLSTTPSVKSCWRGIILYGRNTASYKFALATALLEIKPESGQLIKLEDIAPSFATSIANHLKASPKQITTQAGKFIKACEAYNVDGVLSKLVDATVAYGFANVIDAFHIVGSAPVHHHFYIDERSTNKGIRITEEFSQVLHGIQRSNLELEVDARWRLVETAWNLNLPANLLVVQHDEALGELFTQDSLHRRRSVTSCRSALNGYQKGRCFYCDASLRLNGIDSNTDVDHFFPHRLKLTHPHINLDGVWNLVLACDQCNRGPKGKLDRIPALSLLERLHQRNEYLIESHHPLRETLINQTGKTAAVRASFLNCFYQQVQLSPKISWLPAS